MTDEPLPQKAIIYVTRKGKRQIYTTAYTDEQVREALQACVKRHGAHSAPIARDADDLDIGDFT